MTFSELAPLSNTLKGGMKLSLRKLSLFYYYTEVQCAVVKSFIEFFWGGRIVFQKKVGKVQLINESRTVHAGIKAFHKVELSL